MFLVIGGNSEIGAETARHLRAEGCAVVTTTRRPGDVSPECILLDFERQAGSFEPPAGTAAAGIFVAVARLAACEADPESSARINCECTVALVDRLTASGVYTLYLSTNQVFDGAAAHAPADAPFSPVSEYGRQKARTEALLRQRMDGGASIGILRLSKVVSPGMPLLAEWSRKLAAGETVQAFSDMTMAPVPVETVAAATSAMMRDRLAAVAQLTGPRDMTYAEVASVLARHAGANPALVSSVRARDRGMPKGSTPPNTTLDSSLLARRYGLTVPDALDVIGRLL